MKAYMLYIKNNTFYNNFFAAKDALLYLLYTTVQYVCFSLLQWELWKKIFYFVLYTLCLFMLLFVNTLFCYSPLYRYQIL